jgi:hypothetical protein
VITGVNEGTTSAVIVISDGKGHTCDVTVPIKVSNNPQDQPVGLEGIAPTSKDGSDGRIAGLIAGKTYQYKAAASMGDYTTLAASDGCDEITGLSAGTYLVRFAAIPGYNAGKAIEVEVPQYVPKSVADLDALSYKVGGVEEKAIPGFNSNTVTYFVVLVGDVENGTEIHLSGVPADSRATVTESGKRNGAGWICHGNNKSYGRGWSDKQNLYGKLHHRKNCGQRGKDTGVQDTRGWDNRSWRHR